MLISLIAAGAVTWPLPLNAQQPAMPVIGILSTASATSRGGEQFAAFDRGLREAGYIENQNVKIEYRWANDDYSRLPALAAELVRLRVAVIVAAGGHVSALAAHKATKDIPIVFTTVTDPVKDGLVASLNRPGGNATGTAGLTSELDPKRLELLHEVKPTASVIGVLVNPNRPGLDRQSRELQAAADKLKLKLEFLKAATEREIDAAFETLTSQRVEALIVTADPFFNNRRAQVVALAAKYNIPAIYPMARVRIGWRPDELRAQHNGSLSPCRHQRGPHSQGRQARRYPRRAADKVPTGHKPLDRQATRPHRAGQADRSGRRDDRLRTGSGVLAFLEPKWRGLKNAVANFAEVSEYATWH